MEVSPSPLTCRLIWIIGPFRFVLLSAGPWQHETRHIRLIIIPKILIRNLFVFLSEILLLRETPGCVAAEDLSAASALCDDCTD